MSLMNKIYDLSKLPKKSCIKCNFCGQNHGSRDCNNEKLAKHILKLRVGSVMEQIVEKCINCPNCLKNYGFYCDNDIPCSLKRLGNNTPSLDLECQYCGLKVEVKSKCLSVDKLPNNIYCKGGNYNMFTDRILNEDLNLILIIYSADRKAQEISIREILWIDNSELKKCKNILIEEDSKNLSNIVINNINIINKLKLKHKIKNISFFSFLKKKL